MNHVVELGASWLLLVPFRTLSALAGAVQICFQLAILISGNLSFLNYLTILPFVWCFDDRREGNKIREIVDVYGGNKSVKTSDCKASSVQCSVNGAIECQALRRRAALGQVGCICNMCIECYSTLHETCVEQLATENGVLSIYMDVPCSLPLHPT